MAAPVQGRGRALGGSAGTWCWSSGAGAWGCGHCSPRPSCLLLQAVLSLIEDCIAPDPAARPSAAEALQRLRADAASNGAA